MNRDEQRRKAPGRWSTLLQTVAVVVVLGIALALRLWNLSFGLPDWYHPDEPLKAQEVRNIAAGNLNPGYFYHPSFMLYAAAAALRLQHEVAGTAIEEQGAVRIGRVVVALLGTGTVLLTFLLGRVAGGNFIGVVAAALLAVAPLHVVCSHYLKEDVPMTFWAVATTLASLRIVSSGRRRDYFITGVLAGVTAGTKYVGTLFVGLPWLAHRERALEQAKAGSGGGFVPGEVRVALLGSAVGFLVTTPYAVLDWWRFGRGLGHEGGNVFTGMAGIAVSPIAYLWTFHLRYSIIPGLGLPATLLALGGFVLALRRPQAAARLLTVIVFVLYTVIETSPYKPPPNSDRYAVPLLPFLAIFSAQMLRALGEWLATSWRRAAPVAVALAVMITIGVPLADAVALDRAMGADTRQAARAWLLAHACGNGRIVLEGALNVHGTMVPSYVPPLPPECQATYTYSLFRRQEEFADVDFIVATSFMYDRFLDLPAAPPDVRRFYEDFFATRAPVAEFTPAYRSYGFNNPTIRVFRNSRQSAVGSTR